MQGLEMRRALIFDKVFFFIFFMFYCANIYLQGNYAMTTKNDQTQESIANISRTPPSSCLPPLFLSAATTTIKKSTTTDDSNDNGRQWMTKANEGGVTAQRLETSICKSLFFFFTLLLLY